MRFPFVQRTGRDTTRLDQKETTNSPRNIVAGLRAQVHSCAPHFRYIPPAPGLHPQNPLLFPHRKGHFELMIFPRTILRKICWIRRTAMKRLLAIAILTCGNSLAEAGDLAFPWHKSNPAPVGRVPARVLPKPATTPIEVLQPSRQPYPYGWFGPNPTPQWKRSFGSSKNYTQWSRM